METPHRVLAFLWLLVTPMAMVQAEEHNHAHHAGDIRVDNPWMRLSQWIIRGWNTDSQPFAGGPLCGGEGASLTSLAGQIVSLIALGFCIAGFASKQDDRLMVLLISANVAFAAQFALFGSWTATVLSLLSSESHTASSGSLRVRHFRSLDSVFSLFSILRPDRILMPTFAAEASWVKPAWRFFM